MRQLFLLLGIPASGKDTFLEQRGLRPYSLSSDDLRSILSNPVEVLTNEDQLEPTLNAQNDRKVWETLYQILEDRMRHGETTFVNATHLFARAFSKYEALAQKYNYKISVIDTNWDLYQELSFDNSKLQAVLVARDQGRAKKFTDPESVIGKFANRYYNFNQNVRRGFQHEILSISEFDEKYLNNGLQTLDFDQKYSRIKLIGDVHGDFTNLQAVFADHYKGTAYVFVGDYLDRGTKNAEVFRFLQQLRASNIYFLRGNHENHIENFALHGKKSGKDFGSKTLPELLRAGVTVADLKDFIKKLRDALYFSFDGQEYFVSHAGIEPARLGVFKNSQLDYVLANETEFVMGLAKAGQGPYDNNVDERWDRSERNVHGHRNNFGLPAANGNSYNLTAEGEFRYLILEKGKAPQTVTRKSIDVPSFVELLREDEDVLQKETGDNIISHNFSREVFEKGRWTPNTLTARGLFTRGDDIVGRGFRKFFNVDENPSARLENLKFPVKIYEKYNGFLGICFWDEVSQSPKVFNKSGVENKWNTLAISRGIIDDQQLTDFYSKPENRDYSVLFEVMGDDHVVYYEHDFAVPIAVIYNQTGRFNDELEAKLGIQPLATVQNEAELKVYLKNYNKKINVEGLVLRDVTGYQLKYKVDYYQIGKILRKAFQYGHFQGNKYLSREVNQRAKQLYQEMAEFTPEAYLKAARHG